MMPETIFRGPVVRTMVQLTISEMVVHDESTAVRSLALGIYAMKEIACLSIIFRRLYLSYPLFSESLKACNDVAFEEWKHSSSIAEGVHLGRVPSRNSRRVFFRADKVG